MVDQVIIDARKSPSCKMFHIVSHLPLTVHVGCPLATLLFVLALFLFEVENQQFSGFRVISLRSGESTV